MSLSRAPVRVFQDQRAGESLDEFSARCVAMTTGENAELNREVDEFVRFLHHKFSGRIAHSVAKVVKGGSLGKGTAVRNSADIDLVIFLNGMDNINDLIRMREPVLDHLQKDIERYEPWYGRVKYMNRTKFSVKYKLGEHEVDLLPAFAVHPTDDVLNREAVYKEMNAMRPKGRAFIAQQFSASLSPLQVAFVKRQDESVKKVIRLLKKWRTEKGVNDLRSYTIELVTIHAAKSMAGFGTGRGSTDDLFRKVLEQLHQCRSIGTYFEENYKLYPAHHTDEFTNSPPYVLDVANSYMNVLHGTNVDRVSRTAADTLTLLRR